MNPRLVTAALPLAACPPDLSANPIDLPRAEAAVRELLQALGQDPDRDGLRDTPSRVARMYQELFAGEREDPADHLARVFDEACDDMVLLRDIRVTSVCEHHLLPFTGTADIAYLPRNGVVGLSKLARTVHTFARRPQVQERLTAQIADALMTHLDARGALVIVRAEHMCMRMRGVREPGSEMITSVARGAFKKDPAARAEAMQLLRAGL